MSVERSAFDVERSAPVPRGAVFLSYASQDAEAARRICAALRASGVEVWFDQNELRGGDAWDQKIRRQIKECTLFMPIVSAHTQARTEGYFRLEWRIADQRTHLMAKGRAFLLPVTIDQTREADAVVPESFLDVQWTRLPGGDTPAAFCARVRGLIDEAGHVRRPAECVATAGADLAGRSAPRPARSRRWRALALGGAALAALAVLGWTQRARFASGTPTSPVAPAAALDEKSVAVLPFSSQSPDEAALADGMHDDVLVSLAKIRDLRVISRLSVLGYRDPATRDLRRIAQDLGVAFVLEAGLRQHGSTLRISVQLTDVREGATRWAESYDRQAGDNFALQSELAQKVAVALNANLTTAERRDLVQRPTQDTAAYELFQRARARYHELGITGSRDDYDEVAALLDQAVARDPRFLAAQVHLVLVHGWIYYSWIAEPSPTRLARARSALTAAERIGRDRPETSFARGVLAYYALDWAEAQRDFRAAEPGLPNDSTIAKWLGLAARRLGDWRTALSAFERSLRLNPLDLATLQTTVETLLFLRRYPEALALLERARRLYPSDRQLGMMEAKARYESDGAREAFLRRWAALPPAPGDPEGLAVLYDLAEVGGDFAEAERVLGRAGAVIAITHFGPTSREPTTLHRAYVAFCRDDAAAARRHAEEALAALRSAPAGWRTEKQRAQAEVLAGRADDGVARMEALRQRFSGTDAVTDLWVRYEFAHACALAGRREEAIATLRQLASEPSAFPRYLTWNSLERHPIWGRFRDDPRLAEIVRSLRSL